jgi:hypothetical protein
VKPDGTCREEIVHCLNRKCPNYCDDAEEKSPLKSKCKHKAKYFHDQDCPLKGKEVKPTPPQDETWEKRKKKLEAKPEFREACKKWDAVVKEGQLRYDEGYADGRQQLISEVKQGCNNALDVLKDFLNHLTDNLNS